MEVAMCLVVGGTEEKPRWVARYGLSWSACSRRDCCAKGHFAPESAAQHGAELLAAWLASWARALGPETCGAQAIRALEQAG